MCVWENVGESKIKMDIWDFVQLPVTCRSVAINNHFRRLQHLRRNLLQRTQTPTYFFLYKSCISYFVVPFIDSKLLPVLQKCHKYCYRKMSFTCRQWQYKFRYSLGFTIHLNPPPPHTESVCIQQYIDLMVLLHIWVNSHKIFSHFLHVVLSFHLLKLSRCV